VFDSTFLEDCRDVEINPPKYDSLAMNNRQRKIEGA
jgi:hypothetical protein